MRGSTPRQSFQGRSHFIIAFARNPIESCLRPGPTHQKVVATVKRNVLRGSRNVKFAPYVLMA
jgi:hypothetical protein